jgi:hypothetical protein
MNLSCLFGRHSALPSDVRNHGLRVSQCGGCGRDMIRMRGRWTTVPRGFRIVWRRLDEVGTDAVPLKLVRNLPVLSRRERRSSLRALARRALDTLDLAASGLGVLGWTIADACRDLRESLQAPRGPQQLDLPALSRAVDNGRPPGRPYVQVNST